MSANSGSARLYWKAVAGGALAASAVSPLAGWTVFGVGVGLAGDWLLVVLYPIVGALAAVGAAVIASLAVLVAFGPDGGSSTSGEDEVRSLGFR